jgi:hypothetical protein
LPGNSHFGKQRLKTMKRTSQTISLVLWLAWPTTLAAQSNAVTAPLPPINLVVQRAMEEASHENDLERAFKQHYVYTRTRVTEYRSSDGDLKSREVKTNENKPRPMTAVHPAPANSQASSSRTGGITVDGDNVRGKAFDRKDFSLIPSLVGRFQFTLVGCETINDRPALVVDFKPKSDNLPVNNIKDRFINHAAGRVWVDAQDYALAKVDLHLTQRVNVFGGLVGAVWKCTYSFDRERADDGYWFVRHVDWHLEGRALIIRRIVDYHEQWTNVHKAP